MKKPWELFSNLSRKPKNRVLAHLKRKWSSYLIYVLFVHLFYNSSNKVGLLTTLKRTAILGGGFVSLVLLVIGAIKFKEWINEDPW